MCKKIEVIGQTFGQLLVLDDISIKKGNRSRRYLKCQCSCGKIVLKDKNKVMSGHTSSCRHKQKKARDTFGKRVRGLPEGEAAFNNLFYAYQRSAEKRDISFELSKEQFKEIVTKPCIYCGDVCQATYRKKSCNGDYPYTGIDRYDNEKGYTVDNCVPCCKVCNRMKSNLSVLFFKEHIQKVLSNVNEWCELDLKEMEAC